MIVFRYVIRRHTRSNSRRYSLVQVRRVNNKAKDCVVSTHSAKRRKKRSRGIVYNGVALILSFSGNR